MIVIDALMLARYPFGTKKLFSELLRVLTALSCQSSLGIALDEESHLTQDHSGFGGNPHPWLVNAGIQRPAPLGPTWYYSKESPNFRSSLGIAESSLRLHCGPTNFLLYAILPPSLPFHRRWYQEYFLTDVFCANICLSVYFPGNSIYDCWY